jgi:DNA polymerase III subunit epsilon
MLHNFLKRLGLLRQAPGKGSGTERWVMVDVETSGLNVQQDKLLAIAAIGLHIDWQANRVSISLGDSFEVFVRQPLASSKDNILIHGIGAEQQRQGIEAAMACEAFVRFVGDSPLLAFHADFDRAIIQRQLQALGRQALGNPWVDLAVLCTACYPKATAKVLDEWLLQFHIECAVRHQAAADTLAQSELLQCIWPALATQCKNWPDIESLAKNQRWLSR